MRRRAPASAHALVPLACLCFAFLACGASQALTPCVFGPDYTGSKYSAEDCPNYSNRMITAFGAQQACFADLFNGCGTDQIVAEFPQAILSNSYLGYGVNFTPCCNNHDNCYGTPGALKDTCDSSLRDCLKKLQCSLIPPRAFLTNEECDVNAETFYSLVRDFGAKAFTDTQKDAANYTARCLAQHAPSPAQ
ncbi:hypothetical protein WJX81_003411 [Elliptochloris bilobata]|uniref:Phospholipase A2 n=1 Tax=Elliptochloris bilobata TaxID=381761 RepID=A0AAW1R9Y4_9CHLO